MPNKRRHELRETQPLIQLPEKEESGPRPRRPSSWDRLGETKPAIESWSDEEDTTIEEIHPVTGERVRHPEDVAYEELMAAAERRERELGMAETAMLSPGEIEETEASGPRMKRLAAEEEVTRPWLRPQEEEAEAIPLVREKAVPLTYEMRKMPEAWKDGIALLQKLRDEQPEAKLEDEIRRLEIERGGLVERKVMALAEKRPAALKELTRQLTAVNDRLDELQMKRTKAGGKVQKFDHLIESLRARTPFLMPEQRQWLLAERARLRRKLEGLERLRGRTSEEALELLDVQDDLEVMDALLESLRRRPGFRTQEAA